MNRPTEDKPDFPYWLVIVLVTGLWLFYQVLSDEVYTLALQTLAKGIWITVLVTVVAFAAASVFGL